MKKVSIKDVAKEAGVSLTTVSHILNQNQDRFSKATIQKVIDAKNKLGYVPNKNARQLRGNKTKLIGVLLPSLTNPFFSTIMQSMDQNQPDDVDLFFLSTTGESLEKNIERLVERGMDGLVIGRLIENPEHLNLYLKKHQIPYVVLDQSEDNGYTDIIRTDESTGGMLAAKHLVDLGHKEIAIIHPSHMMSNMQDRVNGFIDYCHKAHIKMPVKISTKLSTLGGKDVVNAIIDNHVTAVFAINDEMAIGVMRGLADRGLKIPDDISVVGYDNIDFSQYMIPSLTTIAQPMEAIGQTALKLIINKINNNDATAKRIELPNELIIRESTKSRNRA